MRIFGVKAVAVAMIFAAMPAVSSAGYSGRGACANTWYSSEDCTYEISVTVTTDGDVGRPGGFGVGLQLANGQMAYWTAQGGWLKFDGGLVPPADGYQPALPAARTFVVYRGPFSGVCAMTGGQRFDLYAGHGALAPDKEEKINSYHAVKNPRLSADHLRKFYIQMDATRDPRKVGLVYSHECNVSSGG